MATLIPAQPKDCTQGERIVYEALGRDLDPDWIVLHSLGLPGHETKIWGEADIVVLSTKGVFALEVKGGKVSCKEGVWTFGDPNRASYTKLEDPWTQAKGTMFAVKNRLVEVDGRLADLLFGFGVVMPHETFTTEGAEIEQAVLLDRRQFKRNLGYYIGDLHRHWSGAYRQKHGNEPRVPTRDEIKRIRQILRPDVDSAFSLGSYLTGVETSLIQLSRDQIRASRRMAENPRTVVRGKAGTGKTVVAVERALQLSEKGLRVLFLCFNQLLARHLQQGIAGDKRGVGVEVRHVHSLYREVIDKAGLAGRLETAAGQADLFARVYPETFADAAIEVGLEPWDVLVVDEAQDLLTPPNIEAFDLMLANGINRGRWHIFFDKLQNIYGTDVQDQVEKRLAEAQPAFDDLFENCRNTKQVAVQASILSGIDLALDGAPDGLPCDNIYLKDAKHLQSLLESTVARLLKQHVRPQDIAILSPRKRENSMLSAMGSLSGVPLIDAATAGPGDMVFSTMHGFKGLERLVVLAVDVDGIGDPQKAMLHYAGFSRARGLLHVFLHESSKPTYIEQATRFAARMSAQDNS
ncbi:nuclease-related domain-containing DEAD/DEAH box helicase [Hydrogenophaga sp.]|uniref:nuclease-related domain-containing DEAD/DEAH box helicase n=1 Tax=Hydrogenophaga sp. TaxID=1904254 RepID=UPI00273356D8|nr:nuclease-related domain-containing DEAD/DEAH box helicase [Hydrogenophaga sp.]MDP3883673.1 NERD domain-containing protein [Hydrogenophaga sp.]